MSRNSKMGHLDSHQMIECRKGSDQMPRALQAAHTAFVGVLIPTYARQYGPGNFV